MVNIYFNTHMSERELLLDNIVTEMFEYDNYYLIGYTNTSRTVCDGEKYLTFGVTDFYKPTRTYFIVNESQYIPDYKKYTSFKKFCWELL
jgi:hypothetical protein